MLETHRNRGYLFADTHLKNFFRSWRKSDAQLEWVIHPGDPNQINDELVMYILAIYTIAIRGTVLKKKLTDNSPSVSPVDVLDHMITRAKSHPIALCILVELRYAEVIFMLQDCERTSRCDLFLASIKFLSPLLATTHATTYVSMTADFLIDWSCMSDPEKIIYAKALLTRKTIHGCNIFMDRFVEWMIKDFRQWLGKYISPNHHTLIERIALTMNEKKSKIFWD